MLPEGWRKIGEDLERPESVFVENDGTIFVSHKGHGVCQIDQDGPKPFWRQQANMVGCHCCPMGLRV